MVQDGFVRQLPEFDYAIPDLKLVEVKTRNLDFQEWGRIVYELPQNNLTLALHK